MSRRNGEQGSGDGMTQAEIDEIVEEIRAELEENPAIIYELLEMAKAFSESMRSITEKLEASNRIGERNRKEIDALKADLRAAAR